MLINNKVFKQQYFRPTVVADGNHNGTKNPKLQPRNNNCTIEAQPIKGRGCCRRNVADESPCDSYIGPSLVHPVSDSKEVLVPTFTSFTDICVWSATVRKELLTASSMARVCATRLIQCEKWPKNCGFSLKTFVRRVMNSSYWCVS